MSKEQKIIDNLSEVIRDALEYNYGSDEDGLYHWRYQALLTLKLLCPKAYADLDPDAKRFDWNGKKRSKEKMLPCPYCGDTAGISIDTNENDGWFVSCKECGYRSKTCRTAGSAIEVHNILSSKAKGVVNA